MCLVGRVVGHLDTTEAYATEAVTEDKRYAAHQRVDGTIVSRQMLLFVEMLVMYVAP